jgi:hypothetical protein
MHFVKAGLSKSVATFERVLAQEALLCQASQRIAIFVQQWTMKTKHLARLYQIIPKNTQGRLLWVQIQCSVFESR